MNSRKRSFNVDRSDKLTSENDLKILTWANLSVSFVFGQMKGLFQMLTLLQFLVQFLTLYYERPAIFVAISQRFCCNQRKTDA